MISTCDRLKKYIALGIASAIVFLSTAAFCGSLHLGRVSSESYHQSVPKTIELMPYAEQPLRSAIFRDGHVDVESLLHEEGVGVWRGYLQPLDMILLKDYLDTDGVPTSLALPCVEKAPMVVAVSLGTQGLSLRQERTEGMDGEIRYEDTSYFLNEHFLSNMRLDIRLLYPFCGSDDSPVDFRCEAIVKFFLAAKGSSYNRVSGSRWSNSHPLTAREEWESGYVQSEGVIAFKSSPMMVSFRESSGRQDQREMERQIVFSSFSLSGTMGTQPFMEIRKRYFQDSALYTKQYKVGFPFYDESWRESSNRWRNWNDENPSCVVGDLYPSYAVFIRILDRNGKVVECVPATFADDQMNGLSSYVSYGGDNMCGQDLPLLRFTENQPIRLTDWGLECLSSGIEPRTYLSVDPRWNYAPENWIAYDSPLNLWSETITRFISFGLDGRDVDPLMAVSDQEYLQSVSEFAFLPRVGMGVANYGRLDRPNSRFDGRQRTRVEDTADWEVAWKTYSFWTEDGRQDDGLYEKIAGEAEDIPGGVRDLGTLPPTLLLCERLENAPVDWLCAGTNATELSWKHEEMERGGCFLEEYSFSEYSRYTRMYSDDFKRICESLNDDVCDAMKLKGISWQEAFSSLKWFGHDSWHLFDQYAGVQLRSVDRKMLYGYWRDLIAQWKVVGLTLEIPEGTWQVEENEYTNLACIATVVFPESVCRVGSEAFSGCTGISNLYFKGCNRNNITLDEGAFRDCNSLKEVDFGCRDVDLRRNAFLDCTNLLSVVSTNGCLNMDEWCFRGCTVLTNITASARYGMQASGCDECFPTNVSLMIIGDAPHFSVGGVEGAKFARVVLGEGIEEIYDHVFHGWERLAEVSLPSTLRTLGAYAFASTAIRSVDIPASVYAVKEYAFSGCPLVSIRLYEGLERIGAHAFDGDGEILSPVVIPSTVSEIDEDAFADVRTGLSVANGNKYFVVEEGALYELKDDVPFRLLWTDRANPDDVVIADTVEVVDPSAFGDGLSSLCVRSRAVEQGLLSFDDLCDWLADAEGNLTDESVDNLSRWAIGFCKDNLDEMENLPWFLWEIGASITPAQKNELLDAMLLGMDEGDPAFVCLPQFLAEMGYYLSEAKKRDIVDRTIAAIQRTDGTSECLDRMVGVLGVSDPVTVVDGVLAVNGREIAKVMGLDESWTRQFAAFELQYGSDWRLALVKPTGKMDPMGNRMTVWQDYVAGTDPTDPESKFTSSIVFENGEPVVTWSPDLNDDGKHSLRKYTTYGCENIGGNWKDMSTVPEADKSNYHFFKVTVEMP